MRKKFSGVLGCLSVGLVAAVACGGESSRSDDDEQPGEAGATNQGRAGAAGSSSDDAPAGAAGDSARAGEGGAVSNGGAADTGGRATGGVATGGITTGGAATGGISSMDPIPIPEGCEPVSATEGSGSCAVGFTCNRVYLSLFCNEGSGDAWKCYCKGDVETSYDLRAETSGAACAVAGAFCAGKGPDLGELPEECEPRETVDSTSCSRKLHCEYAVELDVGTAVLVEETTEVACGESGVEGSVLCSCGADDSSRQETLLDVAVDEACGPALSLCGAGQRRPTGQRECKPESTNSSVGTCSLTQGCAQPLELDDGTVVSVYSPEFVGCVTTGDDQSQCECGGYSGTITFDVATDTTLATCLDAGDICSRRDELEPGEEWSCAVQSQSVFGNACNTDLTCSQSGTLGEVEVARKTIVNAACSETDAGWDCSCSSAIASTAVDVEAADAWDACTAASAACPEALGLF